MHIFCQDEAKNKNKILTRFQSLCKVELEINFMHINLPLSVALIIRVDATTSGEMRFWAAAVAWRVNLAQAANRRVLTSLHVYLRKRCSVDSFVCVRVCQEEEELLCLKGVSSSPQTFMLRLSCTCLLSSGSTAINPFPAFRLATASRYYQIFPSIF